MRDLALIWKVMLAGQRRIGLAALALALTVLLFGIGLLGLSGWFLTAASAAGMIGVGIAFDVFRPSAGVRGLALGRTIARYGERLTSHELTLRAVERLRVSLLRGYGQRDAAWLGMMRRGEALNRINADTQQLDGLALRLVLPLSAGLLATILAFIGLVWLGNLALGLAVIGPHLISAAFVIWLMRGAAAPSRESGQAIRAFRANMLESVMARSDLTVMGRLGEAEQRALGVEAQRRALDARLHRRERLAGAALGAATLIACTITLLIGPQISPAITAMAFFAALAMSEVVAPLRRALSEYGRIADAGSRIAPMVAPVAAQPEPRAMQSEIAQATLSLSGITRTLPGKAAPVLEGFSLDIKAGEVVALTGPSGVGKSTLLNLIARLDQPDSGRILIGGQKLEDWSEPALREVLTYLPQRSALISGSLRDNLCMGRDDVDEAELAHVRKLFRIDHLREGLDLKLGDGGNGLSGGEARRVALARAALRKPRILLLDEPTEGLDPETARAVLLGLREYLPEATILTASHRAAERDWADRQIALGPAGK